MQKAARTTGLGPITYGTFLYTTALLNLVYSDGVEDLTVVPAILIHCLLHLQQLRNLLNVKDFLKHETVLCFLLI